MDGEWFVNQVRERDSINCESAAADCVSARIDQDRNEEDERNDSSAANESGSQQAFLGDFGIVRRAPFHAKLHSSFVEFYLLFQNHFLQAQLIFRYFFRQIRIECSENSNGKQPSVRGVSDGDGCNWNTFGHLYDR